MSSRCPLKLWGVFLLLAVIAISTREHLPATAGGTQDLIEEQDLFLANRDYEKALLSYKEAVDKDPMDAQAYFQIGFCDANLGRYQEAIEAFKRAIQIEPNYPDAYLNLGSVYGRVGRYQEALKAFDQAICIDPEFADAYGAMGWVYHRLGRGQEEAKAYEQAVRIRPDYAEAHLYLGAVYLHLGDKASAVAEYRVLKKLDRALAEKLIVLIREEKRWVDVKLLPTRIGKGLKDTHNLIFDYGYSGRPQGPPGEFRAEDNTDEVR